MWHVAGRSDPGFGTTGAGGTGGQSGRRRRGINLNAFLLYRPRGTKEAFWPSRWPWPSPPAQPGFESRLRQFASGRGRAAFLTLGAVPPGRITPAVGAGPPAAPASASWPPAWPSPAAASVPDWIALDDCGVPWPADAVFVRFLAPATAFDLQSARLWGPPLPLSCVFRPPFRSRASLPPSPLGAIERRCISVAPRLLDAGSVIRRAGEPSRGKLKERLGGSDLCCSARCSPVGQCADVVIGPYAGLWRLPSRALSAGLRR